MQKIFFTICFLKLIFTFVLIFVLICNFQNRIRTIAITASFFYIKTFRSLLNFLKQQSTSKYSLDGENCSVVLMKPSKTVKTGNGAKTNNRTREKERERDSSESYCFFTWKNPILWALKSHKRIACVLLLTRVNISLPCRTKVLFNSPEYRNIIKHRARCVT